MLKFLFKINCTFRKFSLAALNRYQIKKLSKNFSKICEVSSLVKIQSGFVVMNQSYMLETNCTISKLSFFIYQRSGHTQLATHRLWVWISAGPDQHVPPNLGSGSEYADLSVLRLHTQGYGSGFGSYLLVACEFSTKLK